MQSFGRVAVVLLSVVGLFSIVTAQDFQRKVVQVPQVDPSVITIDAVMDETAWSTAASANLVTSTGFEIFSFPYDRAGLAEPEYDELVGKMLWTHDTLYLFIHIDEFVNDSTDLYWGGQWVGDQLFVGLSSRLGVEMEAWYDGNVYASPEGPYHFLILGDDVSLNGGSEVWVPDRYKKFEDDTTRTYDAADIARWATSIDKTTGVWNIEMAIYHPHVAAGSRIGFNMGGSMGSEVHDTTAGDAYGYYCWQPSVVDEPFTQPSGVPIPDWGADPGSYILANSVAWAMLEFTPGAGDYVRKVVEVPEVDTSVIQIDGAMDESAWQGAATANLVTSTGFEMFAFPYDRAGLAEPEYDEFVGRMLWSRETLYVFVTVDEFVNDSTDLYWGGQWVGDQLFIGLSSRLGVEMEAWYDGNVYAAPEGPYHFLILGDDISLNGGNETWLPDRYQAFPDDTVRTYNASDIARWATTIDKTTGKWTIEMAIHDPNALAQARTAFNIGGSMGSEVHDTSAGDAYGYYCWQPSVADEPFTQPPNVPIPDWGADPGSYILANSVGWALLEYKSGSGTVNVAEYNGQLVPEQYRLEQNYPNPFNPSTVIGYGIPHQGKVMLTVYNLLGQKVAILADEVKDAGFYHATWNAAHVGTGVYFYELRVDNAIVSTKKMLLTK